MTKGKGNGWRDRIINWAGTGLLITLLLFLGDNAVKAQNRTDDLQNTRLKCVEDTVHEFQRLMGKWDYIMEGIARQNGIVVPDSLSSAKGKRDELARDWEQRPVPLPKPESIPPGG